MKKVIALILTLAITLVATGCQTNTKADKPSQSTAESESTGDHKKFSYEVIPGTLELTIEWDGKKENVSLPQKERKVDNLKKEGDSTSFTYPEDNIGVTITQKDDYLDVSFLSLTEKKNSFVWPVIAGENYVLPIQEGKYIAKDDKNWKKHLSDQEYDTIEGLSMGFFGVEQKNFGLVYTIINNYNNTMTFDTKDSIIISLNHEYPTINPLKEYGYRIHVTENNIVDMAKTYKNYVVEAGQFATLEDKAKKNPDIKKLYGAPHIYLWDETVLSETDVKWNKFRTQTSDKVVTYMINLLRTEIEEGSEPATVLAELGKQDYADSYQKFTITQAISKLLLLPDFYDGSIFTKQDSVMKELLDKGVDQLNEREIIDLNKRALYNNLPDSFAPVEDWANDRTTDLIKDLKGAGVETAWLGLNNWVQGYVKPEMVKEAVDSGYLIGPYDSYHSIHEPGKEQWNTAAFPDKKLYEDATVTLEDGKKAYGFQNVGRKLSPSLSIPSVKERLNMIMDTDVLFNSWFIDCDATGEIYDDYSKEHTYTKSEDLAARLERMNLIKNDYNMIIGSEGGNDFASTTIAFAHGIELPTFSWMDDDMKKNKDSEYFIGKYYNVKGGAPEKVTKQIPVKEKYKKLFMDPVYNIPLYKLVYNDSVITTSHWDWSNLKIKDEVTSRMLYDILYNVPPLYHLDKFEWEQNKEIIAEQTKLYASFSKEVINEEMTDFQILSDDRQVQMTEFGGKIKVIANFSDKEFKYNDVVLDKESILIENGSVQTIYPEK